jgi:hypothetical protein
MMALVKLFNAVRDEFACDGTPCEVRFGWTEPAKQVSGNRVLFSPGDGRGNVGKHGARRDTGMSAFPRSLSTLREQCQVFVVGASTGTEAEQYTLTRELYDAFFRACYLAAHGTFNVIDLRWLPERKERRFGATLVATLEIEAAIPDSPFDGLTPDADASGASLTLQSELDSADDDAGTITEIEVDPA